MKWEKQVVSPWDRMALMGLLPKGDLTQLHFAGSEAQAKQFPWEWAGTRCPQDLLHLLLWVPSPQSWQSNGRARLMVPMSLSTSHQDTSSLGRTQFPWVETLSLGKTLFPVGRDLASCQYP